MSRARAPVEDGGAGDSANALDNTMVWVWSFRNIIYMENACD